MTTATFIAGSGDCWGSGQPSFSATSTNLGIGNVSASDYTAHAWIPFVNSSVPKGTVIIQATLYVVATTTESTTPVKLKIGCEAADNPSAPSSKIDLFGRTLTTAYTTDDNVAAWTAGTTYSWNITTAVQEILDRAGCAIGNTIAVFIKDNASTINKSRGIASSEHLTYAEAILEIVYEDNTQPVWW